MSKRNIFLVVNPTSGGNRASMFLGETHNPDDFPKTNLYVADIRIGNSGEKPIYLQMKELLLSNPEQGILLIVAGGDGTVLWAVEQLWAHDIDTAGVKIGVIPFGTGNDFAKAYGWSGVNFTKPYSKQKAEFSLLIDSWINSSWKNHDLWEVQVEVKQGGEQMSCENVDETDKGSEAPGSLCKIDSVTRKKTNLCVTKITKLMSNYFSFGQESRVGIGFDRHRQRSKFMNKLVYAIEGLKKSIFHRYRAVNNELKYLTVHERASGMESILFKGKATDYPRNIDTLDQCVSLIASNIPSFAGGLDIWGKSKRVGIKSLVGYRRANSMSEEVPVESAKCGCCGISSKASIQAQPLLEHKQSADDQKLEWLTFKYISSFGAEQLGGGHAKRVHAGGGDFCFKFRSLAASHRTYFQIDGEFYQATGLKEISIRHHRSIRCIIKKNAKA